MTSVIGHRSLALLLAAATLAGCVGAPRQIVPVAEGPEAEIVLPLFDAADALTGEWRHVRIWKENTFDLIPDGEGVAIRATGNGSSSGLVRYMEIDTAICPVIEWSWRVDSLPPDADLTIKDQEDVAAAIFFVFGDPGPLGAPAPVPTLRYVWATEANPENQVIDSPYLPGVLRSVVVESGTANLGAWVTERRSIAADYEAIFGEQPEGPVEVFALFTDNDHTEAPTVAQYRWARARCTEEPDGPSIF
ncbi:MAG: DUF3047 domain-containing protein [Pseudomonadota bacterium]